MHFSLRTEWKSGNSRERANKSGNSRERANKSGSYRERKAIKQTTKRIFSTCERQWDGERCVWYHSYVVWSGGDGRPIVVYSSFFFWWCVFVLCMCVVYQSAFASEYTNNKILSLPPLRHPPPSVVVAFIPYVFLSVFVRMCFRTVTSHDTFLDGNTTNLLIRSSWLFGKNSVFIVKSIDNQPMSTPPPLSCPLHLRRINRTETAWCTTENYPCALVEHNNFCFRSPFTAN